MAVRETTVYERLEGARKAVVAFIVGAGAYVAALQAADLSTLEGVIGFVLVVLNTAGVYGATNEREAPVDAYNDDRPA